MRTHTHTNINTKYNTNLNTSLTENKWREIYIKMYLLTFP